MAAVGATLRTAGRTVLFLALTVAVSLSAMLLFPMYFLRSFAYAGVAVVLLAAAAALILLPRPWCCSASGSTPWTCGGCGCAGARPAPRRNRDGAGHEWLFW